MGKDERRKNVRVGFQTTVTLRFVDGEYAHCQTKDLSLKGIYIPGITDRDPGEKCEVSITLSGSSSQLKITMDGEVVRKTDVLHVQITVTVPDPALPYSIIK